MKEEQQTITGEQVEQSLEEKVREILEPLGLTLTYAHDDEVSLCSDAYQYWITKTHVRWADQEKTFEEYHKFHGAYRKAFESIAALLTAQPESEQTLEEAVNEIVSNTNLIVSYVHDNEVSLDSGMSQHYYVSATHVKTPNSTLSLGDYVISDGRYSAEFQAIGDEISRRSTKPSYFDLEQRVEELEKESKRLAGDYDEVYDECEEAKKRHREARKLMKRYQEDVLKAKQKYDNLLTDYQRECEALENMRERLEKSEAENASLLDKFGPIDQAEQMYAQADHQVKSFAAKLERWAQGIIQLNEEIL